MSRRHSPVQSLYLRNEDEAGKPDLATQDLDLWYPALAPNLVSGTGLQIPLPRRLSSFLDYVYAVSYPAYLAQAFSIRYLVQLRPQPRLAPTSFDNWQSSCPVANSVSLV